MLNEDLLLERSINRSRPQYLRASVERLEVICDRPLLSKSDICQALREYGFTLPDEQRKALERYCG